MKTWNSPFIDYPCFSGGFVKNRRWKLGRMHTCANEFSIRGAA